ncbi:MAG: hypothetical protein F6K11_16725 [Leptolyngbya sp. SIO3F4]|nr:hypothetical protein [Leptolyngbya sp. SIO3F4]
MSNLSPAPSQYRPEAIETAIERVMVFGRQLLVEAPDQLLNIVERQARQLLKHHSELIACKQQLARLQGDLDVLKDQERKR